MGNKRDEAAARAAAQQGIPAGQEFTFQCLKCDGFKFRSTNNVLIVFDRLQPTKVGIAPILELECANIECKEILVLDPSSADKFRECLAKHAK